MGFSAQSLRAQTLRHRYTMYEMHIHDLTILDPTFHWLHYKLIKDACYLATLTDLYILLQVVVKFNITRSNL